MYAGAKQINQAIKCLLKIYSVKIVTVRTRPHGSCEEAGGTIPALGFRILLEEKTYLWEKMEKKSQGFNAQYHRQHRADSAMGIQGKVSWWEVGGKEQKEKGEKQKMPTVGILEQVDSRSPFVTDW